MKRAFTLIELLVVIAIIAILASILFPVFAQAKAAAKHTVEISNAKQQSLAVLMYGNDYDDMVVDPSTWNTGNDELCFGAGACTSEWAWTVQPYVKNGALFTDPLSKGERPIGPGWPDIIVDTWQPMFGLNWNYLAPWTIATANTMFSVPVSLTAPAKPADTVMLTTKYTDSEEATWYGWWYFGTGSVWSDGVVDSPFCYNAPEYYCYDGWGTGDFYDKAANLGLQDNGGGGNTGGVTAHYSNQSVVAFVDGHIKSMPYGALAAGTNWTPTSVDGSVVITDATQFIWDIQNP